MTLLDFIDPSECRVLMRMAYLFAQESPDLSNQNGALLINENAHVISVGCNTPPEGVLFTEEIKADRERKYARIEHAERRVILSAAKAGYKTDGLIMVCPWFACTDCARAIIGAGIRAVVGHRPRYREYYRTRAGVTCNKSTAWTPSVSEGDRMMDEAGVKRLYLDDYLGMKESILVNGNPWNP